MEDEGRKREAEEATVRGGGGRKKEEEEVNDLPGAVRSRSHPGLVATCVRSVASEATLASSTKAEVPLVSPMEAKSMLVSHDACVRSGN